jgi:hypothetical protein
MLRRPGHWRKAFDAHSHARTSSQTLYAFRARFVAIESQAMTTVDGHANVSLETGLRSVGSRHPYEANTSGPTSGPPERNAYLREAAERLSAALFQVVHQPTSKARDRSLAALVALIYGPTPFGGVNSLRDVAMRYGMTEQNLFQLMRGHRDLLARAAEPEYEI